MAKKVGFMKRMYIHSEMIAAGAWAKSNDPSDLDEITFSLRDQDDECMWEFGLQLHQFSHQVGGKTGMVLRIYSDAWKALEEAPEIFRVLGMFHATSDEDDRKEWPHLIAAMERVGWKKVKPEIREIPKPVCSACGRP